MYLRQILHLLIAVLLVFTTDVSLYAQQDNLSFLPLPGTMVKLSPAFNLPVLKGIKVHPDHPFRLEFILDCGDSKQPLSVANGHARSIQDESKRLIKYFLASLTTPEKDLWVNLSPYEQDRIVPESFGQTEMGRDLLAQDYLLKEVTASLVYPEGNIGKQFWKRVYEQLSSPNLPAGRQVLSTGNPGTTINMSTFNKVWIVPNKAVVYENAKAGTAYVVESSLKVMTEQDYLATSKVLSSPSNKALQDIVIPQLTKEVNEGKNFAQLRQVYNSLILATWYKKRLKDSILAEAYADKNKIRGIEYKDTLNAQTIYQRYLAAFKKGAYNYIKEEQDPFTQKVIPRKYFSGGMQISPSHEMTSVTTMPAMVASQMSEAMIVEVNMKQAMTTLTKWKQAVKIVWNNSLKDEKANQLILKFLEKGDLTTLNEYDKGLRPQMISLWLTAKWAESILTVQRGSFRQEKSLGAVQAIIEHYLAHPGTEFGHEEQEAIDQLAVWGLPRWQAMMILHWAQDVYANDSVYPFTFHQWGVINDHQALNNAVELGLSLGLNKEQIDDLVLYLRGLNEKLYTDTVQQQKFDALWLAVKYQWSRDSLKQFVDGHMITHINPEAGAFLRHENSDSNTAYRLRQIAAMANDADLLWNRWEWIKVRQGMLERMAVRNVSDAERSTEHFASLLNYNDKQRKDLQDYLLGLLARPFVDKQEQQQFDMVWLAVKYGWTNQSLNIFANSNSLLNIKPETVAFLIREVPEEQEGRGWKERPYSTEEINAMAKDATMLWKTRWEAQNSRSEARHRMSVLERKLALSADKAMAPAQDINASVEPKRGGIDFNSDKMNLDLKNNAGDAIRFKMDPAQMKAFQDLPGFTPVIIRMIPLPAGQKGIDMLNLFLESPTH